MRTAGSETVIAPPNSSRGEVIVKVEVEVEVEHSVCPIVGVPSRIDAESRRAGRVHCLNNNVHLAYHALRRLAHGALLATMADYRRRISTLQTSVDGYGGRSGLPMPSTAKKPKLNSGRMSMSGPALRAPYPVPSMGPGPTPRHSVMRSTNVNPLLMSTSKMPGAYGRTPVHG